MAASNILANLFSAMYNNEMRNKKECLVVPSSNLAAKVLRTMQASKYIGEFETIDDAIGGKIRIQLLGRINRCGVISPRFAVKVKEFGKWERQYLPAVGIGVLIVSTPQGVMSHKEAQEKQVGGRLIGYVY
ncbi:MAG TPA: 30S ribosomal protein S8 [Nitrososphaerales archaeon]|uniref:Small ribosomal subunit protein uS8 n=1 Tax=uncultured thaumarchaeote Rifle_16ft_4_minimus_1872 TaxID=1665209 RepID=A0A0H4T411_9ARCH|nr:30S ribosomal protein S8 [uncultured thaumarchaeote Rifle_16ft_4_minimus_1872]